MNVTYRYTGDGGPATSATLYDPFDIALNTGGNIYIADRHKSAVRKINSSGYISTVVSKPSLGNGYSGDGGLAINAQLYYAYGVAFDTIGDLYVVDGYNGVIRKVNSSGYISTVVGNQSLAGSYSGDGAPAINAALNRPKRVAFDSLGNMFITDALNNVVRKVYL